MATLRRVATVTLASGWPVRVPNVPAHQNLGAGTTTPDIATYVEANNIGQLNRYGGFDFSAIPPGSTINAIRTRQLSQNGNDDPDDPGAIIPGIRFRLFALGVQRDEQIFDVTAEVPTVQVMTSGPVLSRDELAAGDLRVEKFTRRINFPGEFPPVPDG